MPKTCLKLADGAVLVVAADSGLNLAEAAGFVPDYITGDMDSLGVPEDAEKRLAAYPSGKVLRYPCDKDFTDTELAVALLFEKGCTEIIILGGGGGRLSHILAIRALFEREQRPLRWVTDREDIRLITEETFAETESGRLISVFPVGEGPWRMRSEGLAWKTDDVPWSRGNFGISNRALNGRVRLHDVCGAFLFIEEYRS